MVAGAMKKVKKPAYKPTRSVQMITQYRDYAVQLKARCPDDHPKIYRRDFTIEGKAVSVWFVVADDDDIPF